MTHRALAQAGLVVSGAFLISRILGWIRVAIISIQFGAGPELDAFFAAFRLPDLIFQLVAAGALSSALIPIVAGLLTTDDQQRAWRVVSTVTNLMLAGLVVLAAIVFVAAPEIVRVITPGFDEAQVARTAELTRIMLLGPIFLALGSVATSLLNAQARFAAAAAAPDRLQPRDHRCGVAPRPVDGCDRPRHRRRRRLARPSARPAAGGPSPRVPIHATHRSRRPAGAAWRSR